MARVRERNVPSNTVSYWRINVTVDTVEYGDKLLCTPIHTCSKTTTKMSRLINN